MDILQRMFSRPDQQRQKTLQREWQETVSAGVVFFHYPQEAGLVSRFSERPPIVGDNYRDCNALIMTRESTGKSVQIHLSPYVLSAGAGKPTEYVIDPRKKDYLGEIATRLKELFPDGNKEEPLSSSQIDLAESDLKVAIIGGDKALAGTLYGLFEGGGRQVSHPREKGNNLIFPKVVPSLSFFGNGPKTILSSSETILVMSEVDGAIWRVGYEPSHLGNPSTK